MIKKEDLEKRFKDKSISDLENMALSSKTGMRQAQIDFVTVLFYLETSRRYKENKRFKNASFDDYLNGVFAIRYGTYFQWRKAIIKFPEHVKNHNIGLVNKVINRCGPMRVDKVFSEIEKTAKKYAIDGPRVYDAINSVIDKNSINREPIKKETTDYKAMYEREVEAHNHTREMLLSEKNKNAELTDQIKRLKASLKRAA